MTHEPDKNDLSAGRFEELTRRKLLATGAAGALAVMGAAALPGCGSGSSSSSIGGSTTSAGKPKRGGTLKVGIVGSGSSEQVAPSFLSPADTIRSYQIYDRLWDISDDLKSLVPQLALSAEPNRDASVWTIKLRDGVVFHNGKPFGADDVVYTIKSWAGEESNTFGSFDDMIDFKGVRKRDRLTVEVPLLTPIAQFPYTVAMIPTYGIVPEGISIAELKRHPIGTGPFKFDSFRPGVQSTFSANRDYWQHGKPYVDELIINSSFTEPNPMYYALLSGNLDVLVALPPVRAREQASSNQVNVLQAKGANAMYFYMDVTQPPLNDPRVRKAIKLMANRQELVDNVWLGYGTPANDLFGIGAQYYAEDLVIEQDIEQAKSLLKAAGQENLNVTLSSTTGLPGALEAATLLSQQAQAAGATLKVENIPSGKYYSEAQGYPWTIGQDYYSIPLGSLTAWWRSTLELYPQSRWDAKRDKQWQEAIKELDPTKAAEMWHSFQQQQFDEGGFLVWSAYDLIDATSKNVQGLKAARTGNVSARLLDAWIS